MANWQGAILTNAGIALQARVEAGETKLNLTRLKLGDGMPTSLETMTDLQHPVQVVGITSITPNEDGTIVVNGTVTNADLAEGYYLREYGLFAEDDDGNEVLYCISVDTNPDYLQPKGSATIISEELGLTIALSNVANIDVNVTNVGMASMLDLNNHNKDANAHKDLLHLLQRNKDYVINDITHNIALPSWLCLRCIQAGRTGNIAPALTAVAEGDVITDGTAKWLASQIGGGTTSFLRGIQQAIMSLKAT